MTFAVLWADAALDRLVELHDYIAESNESAAARQFDLVERMVARLGAHPHMGRIGRCRGTRELVIPGTPYIAAYRIRRNTVEVLAVMHGAQRWPRTFSQ